MARNAIRRELARISAVSAGILVLSAGPAAAISVYLTDPTPTPVASQTPCPNHGAGSDCGSVAHVFLTPISFAANYVFDAAFAAWNTALPVAQQWTKVNGGALTGALNVSEFDAVSSHTNHGVGGLDITIDFVYSGADRDDFVWSQGLYDNYLLDGSIVTPFYEMDIDPNCIANSTWCQPVYPFQYNDEHFFDGPRAPFDTGFFEADAFLTKADYTNRVLTVYEGVHYGFYLYVVPEPATGALVLIGLVVMAARRRQHGV